MLLSTTNRSVSGANSILQPAGASNTNQSYHALSTRVSTTNLYFSHWFYDSNPASNGRSLAIRRSNQIMQALTIVFL